MIKRILLALDLDIDTPIATKYAIKIAERFDASLTGLAVVDTKNINEKVGAGGIGTIYYTDILRKQMTEESRQQAGMLLSKFNEMVDKSDVNHVTHMEEGGPYQRIIEDMKYHDLLVIGRESHFFYNRPQKETDTLANIVKNSSAPTLMVTETYQSVRNVVMAHDGSTASSRAIQWFVQLQPYSKKITIDLIHVCNLDKEEEKNKGKLKLHLASDLLKAHGYKNINQELLSAESSNADAIIDYIHKEQSDLVVLGAHSVSAVRRLAFGSTTHDMVQNSPVPLFLSH